METRQKIKPLQLIGGCLAKILSLIVLVVVGVPSLWLIIRAITGRGRLIGILCIIISLTPITLFKLSKRAEVNQRIRWGTLIALLTLTGTILLLTPSPIATKDATVTNQFVGEPINWRFAMTNIIPEIELFNLAIRLYPSFEPLVSQTQARNLEIASREVYREMQADQDFRALSSTLPLIYGNWFDTYPADSGHYTLYVPPNPGDGPMPAIVLLHGSGGSYKSYIWLMSQIAEEHGAVVIAPNFGIGDWYDPGGTESIFAALDDASSKVDIDPDQVILVGYSKGGLGVTYAAVDQPDRFKGLVYISAIFDSDVVSTAAYIEAWRGRPLLVVMGEADKRIPIVYTEYWVERFTLEQLDVTYVNYPEGDHFIVVTEREDILRQSSEWLSSVLD